jgi:hypothetical protein
MPNFLFELPRTPWREGVRLEAPLPDAEAAWFQAYRLGRDLLEQNLANPDECIHVANERGEEVLSFTLSHHWA